MGRTAFMKATSPPNFIEIHQSVWPKSRNKQASKQADKNPPIPSTLGVEPRPCSLRSLGQLTYVHVWSLSFMIPLRLFFKTALQFLQGLSSKCSKRLPKNWRFLKFRKLEFFGAPCRPLKLDFRNRS